MSPFHRLLLSILLYCIPAVMMQAQDSLVTISSPNSEGIEAEPRSLQMTVFTVQNTSDQVLEFTPVVTLPEGWNLGFPLTPQSIEPEGSGLIMVSFSIPKATFSGEFTIRLDLEQQGNILGTYSVPVEIAQHIDTVFTLTTTTENYIYAGDSYSLDLEIINTSNTQVALTIAIESSIGSKFDAFDPLVLEPFENRILKKEFSTPGKSSETVTDEVTYTISFEDGSAEEQSLTASTKVFPVAGIRDLWHMFAMKSSLSLGFRNTPENPFSASASITGSDYLDDTGHHYLSFSIVPPGLPSTEWDITNTSLSASYRYQGDNFSISAGQGSRSFKGMVSRSASGWGGNIAVNLEAGSLNGYLVLPDDGSEEAYITGVSWETEYGEVNTLKVSAVIPEVTEALPLLGINSFIRPYDSANITLDFATGFTGIQDYALSLKTEEKEKKYTYSISYQNSGNDFTGNATPGYYSLSGNGSLSLYPGFIFSLGYIEAKRDLTDDEGDLALFKKTINTSATYNAPVKTSYKLKHSIYKQLDLGTTADLSYEKQTTSFDFSWAVTHNAKLYFETDLVKKFDFTSQITSYNFTYKTALSFRPTAKWRITTDLGVSFSEYDQELMNSLIASSFNASYILSKVSNLTADIATNWDLETAQAVTTAAFGYSYFPENGITLNINASYILNWKDLTANSFTASLSYIHPFEVPTSRKSTVGSLEGFCYDISTGAPLSGVLVTVEGITTVTDSQGVFTIAALKEGSHSVELKMGDENFEYVAVGDNPLDVEISGRENTSIKIPFVKEAQIVGKLIMMIKDPKASIFDPDPAFLKSGGIGNALLEITNGVETRRTFTSSDGSFIFSGLQAGTWTITAYQQMLPETHKLEESEHVVTVEIGETQSLEILAVPIERRIQFIQEEIIEVE